jgi:hypothetical protein
VKEKKISRKWNLIVDFYSFLIFDNDFKEYSRNIQSNIGCGWMEVAFCNKL